ncbi:MAG: hypothetical protein ACJ72N_16985 [Labedaea sp.]
MAAANHDLEDRVGVMTRARDGLAAQQAAAAATEQTRLDAPRNEDEVGQREAAAQQREDALKARETEVKTREDTVTQQETVQAQNTITEGNWTVGVDVQPGTYRTKETVSDSCYWEISANANGSNIMANDIVTAVDPR